MDKNAIWKWLLLVMLTAWSLVLVTPLTDVKDEQGNVIKRGKVKLGLDLQGGISFLLEVDTTGMDEDAKGDAQLRALEVIRNRVDLMGTQEPIIYPEPRSQRIVVQIPGLDAENREWAIRTLESAAYLEFRMVHRDNDDLVSDLFEKGLAPEGYSVASIEEQTPMGQMRRSNYYRRDESVRIDRETERAIREKLKTFQAPAGHEFMLAKRDVRGQTYFEPYFVEMRAQLTGENLSKASIDYQQFGQPIVRISFDSEGTRRFRQLTRDYAPGGQRNPSPDGRRYLGIILDGTLHSAPFIRTPIYDGEAIIEGQFTMAEARELELVLRSGSLPAPLNVIEERNVDPTLGYDSIVSGTRAAMLGGALVLVFMLGYYLLAGVVANLGLAINIVLLPLGMVVVSGFLSLLAGGGGGGGGGLPTLTLPGIAGIVLTIGMAVDANVLIFERIREEQHAGKRLASAVEAGYEKVFSTIFDANITTLITAIILFWQGSGPIRGFAVTLSAGIVVSMFVALVITRLFFELLATKTNIQQIKMFALLRDSNLDFLGKRKIVATLSIAVILSTWFMFLNKGQDNFGVDFTGGTSMTFEFQQKKGVDEIRSALALRGVSDAFIQYQRELAPEWEEGELRETLLVKVGYGSGDAAKEALLTDLADGRFRVLQEDTVGPQVGKDLRKKGLFAIGFALIGIVIYISFRFEFGFAMGAIVALAHDILITVGIFCLLGNQLSLPIVAALLTIVGYSVNDTIVVFDRIREDLQLIKDKPYSHIANLSINQTLRRTVLTSLTTLITVTMLLVFGGGAIKDFALALFIGIIVGTYSSIFVATPVVLFWHKDAPAKASAK